MSRISQDIAKQIATKLTEPSLKAMEAAENQYQELATNLYEEQIPAEVAKVYSKHPDWFHTCEDIWFEGYGFRREYVNASRRVISNNDNGAYLTLTAKLADKLTTAHRRYEKAKKAYNDLRKETEQALINLRTFKNIRETLPDAEPFLPPPMSNALVLNMESLNKRLSHQPKVAEKIVVP